MNSLHLKCIMNFVYAYLPNPSINEMNDVHKLN